jgi:hypothetical protein
MTKNSNNILFFTFITLLFINNFNVLEVYSRISYSPNDTVYDCYISDVFIEEGEYFIKIRPVQFLWGLSAVIEAKKDGAADYDIDNVTKDTNWYVPNDYYINYDSNKTELKFRLTESSKVTIYDRAVLKKISVKELLKNPSFYKLQLFDRYTHEKIEGMDYYPYEIAVENDKVTIIQEIYIP